jgi:hypothetical protein
MWWVGTRMTGLLVLAFAALRVLFPHISPENELNPGYWHPDTLFDLQSLTHGVGIEDILFVFFEVGIASVLYDAVRVRPVLARVRLTSSRHVLWVVALAGAVAALVVQTHVNVVWPLYVFGIVLATVICVRRPLLISRTLVGGCLHTVLYYVVFVHVILRIMPTFLDAYSLQHFSGVWVGALPIEEVAYAFAFGVMSASIYEYRFSRKG